MLQTVHPKIGGRTSPPRLLLQNGERWSENGGRRPHSKVRFFCEYYEHILRRHDLGILDCFNKSPTKLLVSVYVKDKLQIISDCNFLAN